VVNSDDVVSAILDQSAASMMTTLGVSGVTLKQGTFIAVADGSYISSITLASGSVVMYGE
jgi:ABC-type glucose/galactose transport system permease subunit